MKSTLLLLLISISSYSFSQTIEGKVLDPYGKPLFQAQIINAKNQLITVTDSLGNFDFDLSISNTFGIEKKGYRARWYKLGEDPKKKMIVYLDYYYQEVEQVVVSKAGVETAVDIENVNILDYRPFESTILTLKKKKNTYYIGIDSLGAEGVDYVFGYDKPKYLFEDCLGNMLLVCSNEVYQFVLYPDTMMIVSTMSINDFNKYLKPCVAQFDNGIVMEKLSLHNQAYELSILEKEEDPKVFFKQVDEVSARVAQENALFLGLTNDEQNFMDSISNYKLETRRRLRKIHNGENPDVNYAFAEGKTWEIQASDYILSSYPINVRSFQVNEYVVVVDFEVDSILVYNNKGGLMQSKSFSVGMDIKDVWQDDSDGSVYLYTRENGNHKIFSLDILTGKTVYLMSLKDLPFTKSEKVYNGWLYYRQMDNGFHGIQRLRISSI